MKSDIFRRWAPHDAIPVRVEILGIRDEDDGLSVTIASTRTREAIATVVFREVVAYRSINESFRLRTWQSNDMKGSSSLLLVDGSSWLKWLHDESCGVLDEAELKHYAIYTDDDCVDVASRVAPLVVMVSSGS